MKSTRKTNFPWGIVWDGWAKMTFRFVSNVRTTQTATNQKPTKLPPVLKPPIKNNMGVLISATEMMPAFKQLLTTQFWAKSTTLLFCVDLSYYYSSAAALGYTDDVFVKNFISKPARRSPLINRGVTFLVLSPFWYHKRLLCTSYCIWYDNFEIFGTSWCAWKTDCCFGRWEWHYVLQITGVTFPALVFGSHAPRKQDKNQVSMSKLILQT